VLGLTRFDDPVMLQTVTVPTRATNTRSALWASRWPAIALQECIDQVEAAPVEERARVKFDLPCHTCTEASRCLNAKNKELGPLLYDREILTSPRSSESSLFPRELMAPMLNTAGHLVRSYQKPSREVAVAQAWDLAWSERTGGDYLVCMTAAVDRRTGQRQLLQLERWQRLTFDEQCSLIEAKWRQYGADVVVIESDAAQSIWAQHIAATSPTPVIPHDAGGKRDLAHGVPSLLIQFQNRKWEFPFNQRSWGFEEMENLLSELEAFGMVDGKLEGVGEHDDTVMCLWHLAWGIQTLLLGPPSIRDHVGVQRGRSS
jgi:phage terminase large subunit-like protein